MIYNVKNKIKKVLSLFEIEIIMQLNWEKNIQNFEKLRQDKKKVYETRNNL